MATPTFDLIDSTTLSSSVSSVTFSSIPQGYEDLIVVVAPLATGSADARLRLNSETGAYYKRVAGYGNGSSAFGSIYSDSGGFQINQIAYPDSNDDTLWILQFLGYSNTSNYTTILGRSNKASNGTEMTAYKYEDTTAISTILFYLNSGSYAAGSTFYLYGIVS